jgi:hypothetical protein
MVLDWKSNVSRLREVVRIMEAPPINGHIKTLSQLAGELGFGQDGVEMCRLLIQSGLKTEAELRVYRKKARASLGGEV